MFLKLPFAVSFSAKYIYMLVLVMNKSSTKQNNMRHSTYITLLNSRRFEHKPFFIYIYIYIYIIICSIIRDNVAYESFRVLDYI